MSNLEIVIGIENHVELLSNTKIFSPGKVTYGKAPNTSVHPIDMGFPGLMPSVNKQCVELAIKACHILNLNINNVLMFDRKNYYYPDLVKGFQITQNFFPIGEEGFLNIKLKNGQSKKVHIERLHLEEDTAKQIHKGDLTYIDYNRSGIGLIEVVTKPVLKNAYEACEYIKELQRNLKYLKISDCKMSEGSLRCDINISLRPKGYQGYGQKVEIKNLNSLNNVKEAIEYEVKRQTNIILSGGSVKLETRRFDEKTRTTILMRQKDEAVDYQYFTEPNILPIELSKTWIANIIDDIKYSYEYVYNLLINKYKIKEKDVLSIIDEQELVIFMIETFKLLNEYNNIFNIINGDIKSYLNQNQTTISKTFLTPEKLVSLIKKVINNDINKPQFKKILKMILQKNDDIDEIIKNNNFYVVKDSKILFNMVKELLIQNPNMIEEYPNRPERVNKFLIGQIMKNTKGQASPVEIQKIINSYFKENNNE